MDNVGNSHIDHCIGRQTCVKLVHPIQNAIMFCCPKICGCMKIICHVKYSRYWKPPTRVHQIPCGMLQLLILHIFNYHSEQPIAKGLPLQNTKSIRKKPMRSRHINLNVGLLDESKIIRYECESQPQREFLRRKGDL